VNRHHHNKERAVKLHCLLLGAVLGFSSLPAFADHRADGFGEVIDQVELARIEAQERRLDRSIDRRERRLERRRAYLRAQQQHRRDHQHHQHNRGINVGVQLPFVGAGASINRNGVHAGANVGRINVGAGVGVR
jgi:hypothetical protein